MRAVRIALAGLIGLAGALIGAPAFAAGASITVNPVHGGARSTFTVTYQYTGVGFGFCPVNRARVVFFWDGNQVGQTQLDPQVCGVQVHMRPPRGDRGAGQHQVSAAIDGFPGSQADTTYTVDGTTAPSPTPAMQTDQNSPAPADPTTAAPVMGDSTPPASTDTGAVAAPVATATSSTIATAPVANVQPAWVTWALILGALLVLGGAATLGTVIVRSRRERVEHPDYEYPEYDNPLMT